MAAEIHKSNLEANLVSIVPHPHDIKSTHSLIEELKQIATGEKDQAI